MSEHKTSHLGLIFIRAAVMAGVWAAHFAGWLILGAAYMGGSFECYDHRYENIAGTAFYPLMLVSLLLFSVLCWLPARLLVRAQTLLPPYCWPGWCFISFCRTTTISASAAKPPYDIIQAV